MTLSLNFLTDEPHKVETICATEIVFISWQTVLNHCW